MDTPQPIRVHISHNIERDLILLNGLPLERLTDFTAHCSTVTSLLTTFTVVGCFPVQGIAPDDALSNKVFPLRISFGQTADEVSVVFQGRPLGFLSAVYVNLQADPRRRIIRLTTHKMYKELIEALVDIKGVEVVIDPKAQQNDGFSSIEETTFNA